VASFVSTIMMNYIWDPKDIRNIFYNSSDFTSLIIRKNNDIYVDEKIIKLIMESIKKDGRYVINFKEECVIIKNYYEHMGA
jgi:hypothetical protein